MLTVNSPNGTFESGIETVIGTIRYEPYSLDAGGEIGWHGGTNGGGWELAGDLAAGGIIIAGAGPEEPAGDVAGLAARTAIKKYGPGLAMAALTGATVALTSAQVHGNSSRSQRPTEVYYLVNRGSLVIDKIGITSDRGGRYSQAYLDAENVFYQTQTQYSSRYPAMVDENIRLVWYKIKNGDYPRLNKIAH